MNDICPICLKTTLSIGKDTSVTTKEKLSKICEDVTFYAEEDMFVGILTEPIAFKDITFTHICAIIRKDQLTAISLNNVYEINSAWDEALERSGDDFIDYIFEPQRDEVAEAIMEFYDHECTSTKDGNDIIILSKNEKIVYTISYEYVGNNRVILRTRGCLKSYYTGKLPPKNIS